MPFDTPGLGVAASPTDSYGVAPGLSLTVYPVLPRSRVALTIGWGPATPKKKPLLLHPVTPSQVGRRMHEQGLLVGRNTNVRRTVVHHQNDVKPLRAGKALRKD